MSILVKLCPGKEVPGDEGAVTEEAVRDRAPPQPARSSALSRYKERAVAGVGWDDVLIGESAMSDEVFPVGRCNRAFGF